MKKYSHGWVALKAMERLKRARFDPLLHQQAGALVQWLQNHLDGVIPGAWYPDEVFKDMNPSHIFKLAPAKDGPGEDFHLPAKSPFVAAAIESPLHGRPYVLVSPKHNLPERCEAWAHSTVDHLRIQRAEVQGSPVSPSGNHIAHGLFILSHYVADAHVPPHCDARELLEAHLHEALEGAWEREVEKHFELDKRNERFLLDTDGFPRRRNSGDSSSFLRVVEDGLAARPFSIDYGKDNTYVRDYLRAVCRCSYLLSYRLIPEQYTADTFDMKRWRALPGSTLTYDQLSPLVFSEAIDAVARIWLRTWRRGQGLS